MALFGFSDTVILTTPLSRTLLPVLPPHPGRSAARADRRVDQHPVSPPGPPRLQRLVHRSQLRRHPRRPRPHLRYLPARDREGRLRGDHRPLRPQPDQARLPTHPQLGHPQGLDAGAGGSSNNKQPDWWPMVRSGRSSCPRPCRAGPGGVLGPVEGPSPPTVLLAHRTTRTSWHRTNKCG